MVAIGCRRCNIIDTIDPTGVLRCSERESVNGEITSDSTEHRVWSPFTIKNSFAGDYAVIIKGGQ